jgi:hypothetical protein
MEGLLVELLIKLLLLERCCWQGLGAIVDDFIGYANYALWEDRVADSC